MKTSRKTIIFITGTFLGANCWDGWMAYFESKGYSCVAPPWPHKNAQPEELRNMHPDTGIASNRLVGLVDHFENAIRPLPEDAIIVGHSLGGLMVQLLLQRGVGAAGVALHSFPPSGLAAKKIAYLKAVLPVMGFISPRGNSYMISFRRWKQVIANSMPCEQQKQLFYEYAVPESIQVVRDTFTSAAKIDFLKPRPPLLLTSGGRDKMAPASLNYFNYKKYKMNGSITDYKEFSNHNHLIFDPPSLQEEADYILYWLQGIQ